jgi:phytoene desaturase
MLLHNVFLFADINDSVFKRKELPRDPSLYVNIPTRTDASITPAGHEIVYVLVPVPRLAPSNNWERDGATIRETVYRRLEPTGLPALRQHVVFERAFATPDFASQFNLANGSTFGLSHKIKQVGYMRPSNKARDLGNMYFVGAGTVPGGGIPMVVIGSRLVTERMQQD